jgi:hypothetical protein
VITALFLAAAPVAADPAITLDCKLVTPGGHPIAFAARLKKPGIGTVVLDPVSGTAWPSQRVMGGGSHQVQTGGVKSRHRIAGEPGVDLEIDGEVATLFVSKKLRRGLPRAHGFCLPVSAPEAASGGSTMAAVQAGASIPAFDPASWPDHCELVTRSGRRWKIGYSLVNRGAQSGLTATSADLFGKTSLLVSRRGGGQKARFGGGKVGPSGSETLLLEESQAVQLINFDRTALPGGEPAAAICGIRTIVRRPNSQ